MVVSSYGSPSNAYAESCHKPNGNVKDGNYEVVRFLKRLSCTWRYMFYGVFIIRKISILENMNV